MNKTKNIVGVTYYDNKLQNLIMLLSEEECNLLKDLLIDIVRCAHTKNPLCHIYSEEDIAVYILSQAAWERIYKDKYDDKTNEKLFYDLRKKYVELFEKITEETIDHKLHNI